MLDEIAALSYPTWLTDTAAFLPRIDLSCIATSGKRFLNDSVANSTSATINDFLHAVSAGCSSDSFVLSGGYDNVDEELKINIILEKNAGNNL